LLLGISLLAFGLSQIPFLIKTQQKKGGIYKPYRQSEIG